MHNEPEAMTDRDGEVLFPISSGDDDDQVRIIIECAENKSFVVQKSLITKKSDFFRACLGNDCQESRNFTIRLLDVDPDLMVLYLDLAHRQLQKGREVVILSRDYPLVADWAYPIELYQLIDFLQNVELLKQVGYALRGCISFTPRQMCTVDAEDATIDRILEAFEMLDVNHQYQARFRDNIISAFS
ncbi:Kelch-like protein 30 [Colletotrichum scovillei]|uniref:Kelch-like protein 30 n=1 Tax=Colletotrichum scovillei TaxID=1209932 RepID=A0A9P7RIT2_9PEZI|nr:Kelch-like protein 30 [Colletotrichum scovillei]KAG7077751.1 Kelch-like protein 30 [Colletotrichum scovillei]KAG7084946.1 Kelch-like protein 30 [Colletotrichum scovillei]